MSRAVGKKVHIVSSRVDRPEDCDREKCPKMMDLCPNGGHCYGEQDDRLDEVKATDDNEADEYSSLMIDNFLLHLRILITCLSDRGLSR